MIVWLICLLFGQHVFAGSAVWQPALKRRGSNSSRPVNKRYYYVNPNKAATNIRPWPKRVISYCFSPDANTQGNKATIKAYLKDAHKLWIANGLDKSFRIEQVSDGVCVSNRNEVLMVVYTGATGGMGTYVGFPSSSVVMTPTTGPIMRLTDNAEIGLLNVVSNFAHELGHAWGLYHEHQNPNFWAGVVGANGGEVFGPNNPGGWKCENLKDYYSQSTGLTVQTGSGSLRGLNMDRLCSSQSLAADKRFSAGDYLPQPNVGVSATNGHGADAVDWDSIMLYPSGAGGALDPSGSGTVTADNDYRLPILLKTDGSRIPINLAPSTGDIEAMHAMYAAIDSTTLDVLNSLVKFKKIYKDSGSGPSSGSGCL